MGLVPQSEVSWRSACQRRIATSLSDIRVICLDTLLYIDGRFTVSVIPFIPKMLIGLSDQIKGNFMCSLALLFHKDPILKIAVFL